MNIFSLVTFSVATLAIVAVTVLPFSRNPHWLFRGADFPRLQFAVLAGMLLVGEWFLLDLGHPIAWVLIALTAGCLGWQLWWILPYTVLWPTEVKRSKASGSENGLSILTANVLTPNREAEALLDLVRKYEPDILVTLESDQWWQDRLDSLEPDMPYTLKCPLDNLYGMHVYSRLPLENATIDYLVEKDVPSMHALVRMRTGDRLRIHFLHPAPPSPTENPESAERDAELVIVARSVADSDEPIIVTGDLNDVAWSPHDAVVQKAQRSPRSAGRPWLVQHVSCELSVRSMAARPLVSFAPLHPAFDPAVAADRVGSLRVTHGAVLRACARR